MPQSLKTITKRDGSKVPFDPERIATAIHKAMRAAGYDNYEDAEQLSTHCIELLSTQHAQPTIENIQDTVEQVLIKQGKPEVAKSFIIYRQKRAELRKLKQDLLGGKNDHSKLSLNGLLLAKERYLLKENGTTKETPTEMFKRVAKTLADTKEREQDYLTLLSSLQFIPGGRILANAGTTQSYLLSSYVLPLTDSMRGIFSALLEKAMLQRPGGGTGFSFSRLRSKGTATEQTALAAGPVAFIDLFNHASKLTIQKGNRLGANMASLSVEHPDIVDFITAKDNLNMENFNISVEVTDAFMEAVERNKTYALRDPHNGQTVKEVKAKQIFDIMVFMAWKTGDPGILFIDRINQDNKLPDLGKIETTDPCGDTPLHGYDSAPIGALNLATFVSPRKTIEWRHLKPAVQLAVRFLDSVIDHTNFTLKNVEKMVKANRKIGLGVLGYADMLYQLELPYNSERAIDTAEKVMKFIKETAIATSQQLAKEKSPFPNFKKSSYKTPRRNASLLAIAPSGSRSILTDTSAGIEPHFALGYKRKILGNTTITYLNPLLETTIRQLTTSEALDEVSRTGSIRHLDISEKLKQIFVTAHDIRPRWHVRMQAAFQKHIDGAISKTINFPQDATLRDIENAFLLAWKLGCKGITIYRNNSKEEQVITI